MDSTLRGRRQPGGPCRQRLGGNLVGPGCFRPIAFPVSAMAPGLVQCHRDLGVDGGNNRWERARRRSLPRRVPLINHSGGPVSRRKHSCFPCESEVKSLSHVRLYATPWTVAYQAPPSMEFSRQEYWSGLPFPSPGDLPDPGIEPGSPTLQADALPSEPPGKPQNWFINRRVLKIGGEGSCWGHVLWKAGWPASAVELCNVGCEPDAPDPGPDQEAGTEVNKAHHHPHQRRQRPTSWSKHPGESPSDGVH